MKRLLFSLLLVMACLWAWADNSVTVSFNGNTATVAVDDNIAQYLTVTQSGAHVSIEQSSAVAAEITYTLSGTSTNGEFYMSGSYKATIELNGLTLTNTTPVYSGAAIHIQNGKRINVKVVTGTTNTLTDAASGTQKGCLYVKGHAEFKQYGTLNVVGNVEHGIKAGDYISIKNATINVTSAVADGISCNQYFLMESGTVTINGTGDDGIQCDLDGTTSTGMTTDHEDEDSGNMYISGGNITINCPGIAAKGLKSAGDIYISDAPIVKISMSGKGMWDATDQEAKSASGIDADGNITISGGTLVINSSGSGGKGMKCDNVLTVSGGDITVSITGALYYNDGTTENTNYSASGSGGPGGGLDNINSSYYCSPKGIKAGYKSGSGDDIICYGGINISGGVLTVTTSGKNGEGIESKNYLNVTGGETTIDASDDGINAAQDLYITDGRLYSRSSGNDGIDANGNVVINGGLIYAIGASSPEVAIDANSEENKKFHFNGGVLIAIGGLESGSTLTQACYQTSSVNTNTWYSMTYGGNVIAFLTPGSISSGGGGFPGGGGSSSRMVISAPSTPTLKSGVTVSNGTPVFNGPKGYLDATVTGGSNVQLSQYTSSGGSSGSYSVTASANPTAGGTVSGGGTYSAHSLCTLTATPNAGYAFDNWTRNGSVASTDSIYSFYVTETTTCVAHFTLTTSYTITATVNPTNGGTVTGAGSYPVGSTATLKATANTGYTFANWTKNGSVVSTNATYSFTVSEDESYVANFTAVPQFAINVTANPSEGGTVTGAGSYYQGASVTLKATANRGYVFVDWMKNGAQVSTNPTYTFTVTAAGSYVANFEAASSHNVTLAQTEGGTIGANVSTAYPGDVVTLTATANTGYFFSAWDVKDANNNSIVVTDNQFVMPNSNVTVSATFVSGCTVTIAEVEHGTVTASTLHDVPGTTITLTVMPETDYYLSTLIVYQTGNVLNTVTVTNNSFVLPAYDVTVVAIFKMTTEAEVTIGNGSNTNSYIPTYAYYNFSLTQQIYTASEVGQAGTITKVAFKVSNSKSASRTLDVYLKHTNMTAFTSNTGWETMSSGDRVYSGNVTFNASGWTTIILDTPFEYDGTSNLMVCVDDNTGTYVSSSNNSPQFYVYSTGANRAMRYYNDYTNPDPASPSSTSGSYITSNNQVSFTMAVGGNNASLTVSPNVMSGFNYVEGEGPSAVQSLAVIGTDLTEEITVTAPEDFEISDVENGVYGSTVTLTASDRSSRETLTYDFENGWQGWTAIKGTTGNSPNNWMHNTEYSGYTNQGQINLSTAGNNSSSGFMLSESYISATYSGGSAYGDVTPDNYLVSPQIRLGGSITFYASARMSSYPAENFSVLVSESGNTSATDFTHTLYTVTLTSSTYSWNEYTVDLSDYSGMGYVAIRHYDCEGQHLLYIDDVTIVEGDDTPVNPIDPTDPTVDLLTANVYIRLKEGLRVGTYANETLSVATGDITSNVSLNGEVTQSSQITQVISLNTGWNWFSTYLDMNEVDGLTMLERALRDNADIILSMEDGMTEFDGEEWFGDLDDVGLSNTQMYMVLANADCTVEMEGVPASLADYEITIKPGWNWIGFPSAEALDVVDALASFAADEGDIILSQNEGMTEFDGEDWFGDLETFEPGNGLMYFSSSSETKTLVYSTAVKAWVMRKE